MPMRAAIPDDMPAVRALLARVFQSPPGATYLSPAMLEWKYWRARADFREPRSYVIERGGAILAHAGIWPLTVRGVRGAHMIDWAAAPESPGSGLVLVQKLSRTFDFLYTIGGSEMTRKVLPAFGYQERARTWCAARPFSPVRQIATHQYRNWKLAPRLVRNCAWALWPPRPRTGGCRVEETAPAQIGPDSARGSGFFEYLLQCPAVRFRLYGIREGDKPRGHFALALAHGQARLVTMACDSLPLEAGYALAARAAARLPGACEFAARVTEGASAHAAARAGLRRVTSEPVYVFGNAAALDGHEFQLADDDSGFRDAGTAEYWS